MRADGARSLQHLVEGLNAATNNALCQELLRGGAKQGPQYGERDGEGHEEREKSSDDRRTDAEAKLERVGCQKRCQREEGPDGDARPQEWSCELAQPPPDEASETERL